MFVSKGYQLIFYHILFRTGNSSKFVMVGNWFELIFERERLPIDAVFIVMYENLVKISNFAMLLFSFSHGMYEDHKLCKYAIYTEYKQRFIVNFIVINVLTKKAKYHVLVCLDFVLDFFFWQTWDVVIDDK